MPTKTVALNQVAGTDSADKLKGTREDDLIFSGGLSSGVEKIRGRQGSDHLILDEGDSFVSDDADRKDGRISVIDFTIDDISTNDQADVFNIGGFLGGKSLTASTVGNYLHVVSGYKGDQRTAVYIDKEGGFEGLDHEELSGQLSSGEVGADILVEFRGRAADNNFSAITGESDNTVGQFQTLIDLGFLDLSGEIDEFQEVELNEVEGSDTADRLKGTREDDVIYSGGVSSGVERINGRKGADRVVLDENDAVVEDSADNKDGRIIVRNFTIDNVETNDQADTLSLGDFLAGDQLSAENIGDYIHVVSGRGDEARTVIYLDQSGNLTDEEHEIINQDKRPEDVGVDLIIDFRGREENNFAEITGKEDNTVEQFQALIDLGFLDVSKTEKNSPDVIGTENADVLIGTDLSENIFSKGISSGIESVDSNGGSDRLILDIDDSHVSNNANDANGHYRIRDFIIDDVTTNDQADVLDIGSFLLGSNLNASNIGNYLHVVSGVYGEERTGVFVDREGNFTVGEKAALTNAVFNGGHGADLFLEFLGRSGNNNFEEITGKKDNTVEQFQALIDLGFLDLSKANSDFVTDGIENTPDVGGKIGIWGTERNDDLIGSAFDDTILSGGVSNGIERVRSNGGSDTLVFDADDAHAANNANDANGHFRIGDFLIGDVSTNDQADVLDIGAFLQGTSIDAANIGNYLHVVSGVYGQSRTGVFVDREGNFTAEEKAALTADVYNGGYGADLFLEFQGYESDNNFESLTGEKDNTVEQFQALIDLGFLDLSNVDENTKDIIGTVNSDNLVGSIESERIFSNGLALGIESIEGGGGSDSLILDLDDAHAANIADDSTAHFRIRDFIIDDVMTNKEADTLDIGNFLLGSNLDASNIGNYLHVVSGVVNHNRTGVFVDREGNFTLNEKAQLTNHVHDGGHGADLYLEFQGLSGINNFETITGEADNSVEQFQALIDLGFLDISKANSEFITEGIENTPDVDGKIAIRGSSSGDEIKGSIIDDLIYTEGTVTGGERIWGNGGSDTLIFEADDAHAANHADNSNAHIRVRDFTIGDVATNDEADVLNIADFLEGDVNLDNIDQYLHVVSGYWTSSRTALFINKEGDFTEDDKSALTENVRDGGHGADLYLEFQGHAANNNFADITGYGDNTTEQFRSLIDLGFLEIA